MLYRFFSLLLLLIWFAFGPSSAFAQKKKPGDLKAPDPGYVYPPGGKAGTTVDVQLGGFDWTPDLQFFVLDPAVKLEILGPPGPVLVPPPPYWFGSKSTIAPLPLPREQLARLTLPVGRSGPVRWAVAGASGASPRTGIFWIGSEPEVLEVTSKELQKLPDLPVTVSGRLARIEEVDRYSFRVARSGPVTVEVISRRLGVNLNAAVSIHDAAGKMVADAVDSEGNDLILTFSAIAGTEYTLSLNDLDFRGDRSFVYRLTLTPGPRIAATIPAMGKRGETRDIEFVGPGLATGKIEAMESITRKVTFPASGDNFSYRLETPFGTTPAFDIPLGDRAETAAAATLTLPAAITGVLDAKGEARFKIEGKKADVLDLAAEARRFGSPLDLSLAVLGPDGKELARNDDLPGTTDAGLIFTLPLDGAYTLIVSDQSGKAGNRAATFRLTAEKPTPGFTLQTVARLNVPVGEKAELQVTAKRTGGFKGPIPLTVAGLPEGVSVPAGLVIPADKPELKIAFTAAETAPAIAALITVTGTAEGITRQAFAPIPGNLAARHPDEERTASILLATTLPPRLKLVAVEADGGRKVHRGSTHPAEVTLERINGFEGEVSLQMASVQSYQRQGIHGPDMLVPAKDARAFYPCFMPEWLESTRTSRMALVGVVRVPDAKGKERFLVTPMNGQVTMSIEGAILKVTHAIQDVRLVPGETVSIAVSVLRSAKLNEPVRLELRVPAGLESVLKAEPVIVPPGQTLAEFKVTCAKGAKVAGEHLLTIRGTAMQEGKYAVVSETHVMAEGK